MIERPQIIGPFKLQNSNLGGRDVWPNGRQITRFVGNGRHYTLHILKSDAVYLSKVILYSKNAYGQKLRGGREIMIYFGVA